MPIVEISKIQVRRGQENQTGIPRLDPGEFAWAEDTQNLYIGKRVAEGANTDENARILTDKDLGTVFRLAQAGVFAINSSTAYQYKAEKAILGVIASTTQTYSIKLDNTVSITDFTSTWIYSSGTDITLLLQKTIGTANNPYGVMINKGPDDPDRVTADAIHIPAGYFSISDTITLPPNTKIVGAGSGLTFLNAVNNVPVFQTVDKVWDEIHQIWITNTFYGMRGDTLATPPKNIHLEGMSIIGSSNTPLVRLDNVSNADVLNVNFGDPLATTSTNATGIAIRGFNVNYGQETAALSSNIRIDNCNFNGLDNAVYQNTGTTDRFYIQNSKFSNMNKGVEMWSTFNAPGPVNGTIENNMFERIAREAIYIGTATNTTTNAFVFSSNNTFRDVGNNFSSDAGRQVTPIITFNNSSNRSVDDYFNRLTLPMNTVTNYPAIVGPATIDSSINYAALIGSNTSTEYTIANFALGNREQLVEINYTMIDEGNSVFSRTGQVTLNITPANTSTGEQVFASASDMFNYAELLPFSSNFVLFSTNYTNHTASNYVSLTCWNQLGYDTTSTGLALSTLTNFKIAYQYNILQ